MRKPLIKTSLAIGLVCAIAGAASGIATSSAATKAAATPAATATATTGAGAARPASGRPDGERGPGGPGGGGHDGGPGGGGGRDGIHSESVRADPDGTGFITTVSDTGTLAAIDGTELTIKEGTADETFDTVTVVADGTLTVERNGATSKLTALRVGDHVRVTKDGTDTRIRATTAAYDAKQAKAHAAEHAAREADDAAAGAGDDADRPERVEPTWPAA